MVAALLPRPKTLGNHTYYCRPLATGEGSRLLVKLTKILGPSISMLLREKGKSVLDMDMGIVTGAFVELTQRMEDTDLDYVRMTLGSASEVEYPDGRRVPLDRETQELHFAGNYMEMFRWLAWALEVNYGNFFQSLGGIGNLTSQVSRANGVQVS